jgi:hypothetical protein
MSVKSKPSMSIKLDDRYKAILEIAVEKMKADGIESASKTGVVRQALELYAQEKQITNVAIRIKLRGTEQKTIDTVNEQNAENPEKGTAKAILKHFGTWAGGKEDAEKVLKYIIENRTEAEF